MDFDASLLVIMGIFWAMYLLLRWSFFGPLMEILRERREGIEGARTAHVTAMAEMDSRIEAERAKLNQARTEAAARRDGLRREGEEERKRLLEETQTVTEEQIASAQAELQAEVERERGHLDQRARVIADQMTDKLLEKSA